MPPPKNGSLGRGLGDLLGGVPETIGVAGVPQPPIEKPPAAAVPVPEAAMTPPVAIPTTVEVDAGISPDRVVAKPFWNPSRVLMAFAAGLLLILIGAGIGMWASPPSGPEIRRLGETPRPTEHDVISTGGAQPSSLQSPSGGVGPAEPELIPEAPKPATVDPSVFQPLEASGIRVTPEGDGAVRLVFDVPVFSSRVALDPDQTSCLDQLGSLMATYSSEWDARVVGHTDAVPLRSSGMYRDNKELGLARAVEVIRYLCRHTDVPASMLSAATAGEESPPFPGDDPESRLKNRTVTIVIRQISK